MSAIVAGTASGLLMASVFVGAGVIMLFVVVRDPPPVVQPLFRRVPPAMLAMSGVFLAYPVWGVIGAVMGLLYAVSAEQAPGAGLGSPNQAFTLAILIVAVTMAAPLLLLMRRVLWGVLAIALGFVGVFGWFLPFFAA